MINIQTLINEIVEKNNQTKTGVRDGAKFNVSDAGKCYRERFYKRLGYASVRVIDISALRKMVAGDAGHEKLQMLLRRYGKLFLSESELETEHLKGHPDGIIKTDIKLLFEIKTIEKFAMEYIRKDGAKPEHELQTFTYWSLLRKELKDLDNAVLSYVKREDFETRDFYYVWSDQIQEKVDKEWNVLINYWETLTLPPCTCKTQYNGKGPLYCRYGIDENNCCSEKLFVEKSHENKK